MVSMLLGDMPLSEGYDLIGKKPRINRFRVLKEYTPPEETSEKPKVETNTDKFPELPIVVPEELVVKPKVEDVTPPPEPPKKEESPKVKVQPLEQTKTLPEPQDIPVQEKKSNFTELDYKILSSGNAMDNLPENKTGNYVVIYRSTNCPYCDKLIAELKDNIGDYHLVVVKCSGGVEDVFYSRWITYFPSFIVITNKVVRYYGYGYRTLEEFKRFL